MSKITNALIPIDAITPHPRNYRSHPDTQLTYLQASHERFGQYRSVVLWSRPRGKYVTVAGHGIIEAMRQRGVTEIRADVLPQNMPQTEIDAILMADNNIAQHASDDNTLLAQLLQEQQNAGFDLAALGSDDETLRQMLEALGDGYAGEQEDSRPGPVPLDDVTPRAKVGDIWQLGKHRIGCLDSLDQAQVERLLDGHVPSIVWADPPYGINIVADNDQGAFARTDTGKGSLPTFKREASGTIGAAKPFGSKDKTQGTIGSGVIKGNADGPSRPWKGATGTIGAGAIVGVHLYPKIVGDESIETAIKCYHLCAKLWPKALQFWCGGNYYADHLPSSSCWIVWDKRSTLESEAITSNNFADGELIWTNNPSRVRIYRQLWNGMLRSGTHEDRVHPTQKPVDLVQWCFQEYGQAGDVIYDPFLGSAPSLIAAERLGDRTVYGCELSPAYIDRILSRYEAETGHTATLLSRHEEAVHA